METIFLYVTIASLLQKCVINAFPLNPDAENAITTFTGQFNDTNGTTHDLYIVRTVIYEVGILTNTNNDTVEDDETEEQIDFTFYNPTRNEGAFDLSNIPIPIRRNQSGNFGLISKSDLQKRDDDIGYLPLKVPILPNVLISYANSHSASVLEQENKLNDSLPENLTFKIN